MTLVALGTGPWHRPFGTYRGHTTILEITFSLYGEGFFLVLLSLTLQDDGEQ